MEYIIVFIIAIIFALKTENRIELGQNYLVNSVLTVMPLVIMAGIRDKYVGIDVTWYVEPSYIESLKAKSLDDFFNSYGDGTDYGFCIFVYFITKIFGNFFFVMAFCHALILVGWFYTLIYFKKENDISLTFGFAIILLSQYNESLCLIRQSMATSIALICCIMFFRKKYIISILLCIVAASFHQTIVTFIFAFIGLELILRKIFDRKKQYMLLFCLFLLVIAFAPLIDLLSTYISEKYLERMASAEEKEGGFLTLSFFIILTIIPFFISSDKEIVSFMYLPALGIVFLLLARQSQYLSRLAYPFMTCLMLSIPYKVQNKIIRAFILLGLTILWYYGIYIRKDWGTVPYVIGNNYNF